MPNEVTQRWPWEPAELTTEQTVEALRRDFAYAVQNTAVMVHSSNPAFRLLFNTTRGQIIPRGEVNFTDGTTIELQDVGMCQPNVPHMTVRDAMTKIWELAAELGLEITK